VVYQLMEISNLRNCQFNKIFFGKKDGDE